jgi:HPr kinase/phosphorylase
MAAPPAAPAARRRALPAEKARPQETPAPAAETLAPHAEAEGPVTLHASAVAAEGPEGEPLALLLLGPSGAGKSALALDLIARGARLVADDRVRLSRGADGALTAAPVPPLEGLVEARGLGLLHVPHLPEARLLAACDLSALEPRRLPPRRETRLLGAPLALILAREIPAPALLAFLRGGGRRETA